MHHDFTRLEAGCSAREVSYPRNLLRDQDKPHYHLTSVVEKGRYLYTMPSQKAPKVVLFDIGGVCVRTSVMRQLEPIELIVLPGTFANARDP